MPHKHNLVQFTTDFTAVVRASNALVHMHRRRHQLGSMAVVDRWKLLGPSSGLEVAETIGNTFDNEATL